MKRTQVAVGLFVAIVSVVVTGWLTHEVLEQSLTLVVLSGSIMGGLTYLGFRAAVSHYQRQGETRHRLAALLLFIAAGLFAVLAANQRSVNLLTVVGLMGAAVFVLHAIYELYMATRERSAASDRSRR